VGSIEKLGENFGIHRLVLEDILNTEHTPKIEVYEDYLFFTLKMITLGEDKGIESEQVSIILGDNYVISFQEKEGDVFDPVRERLRGQKGKIRARGADYLLYALVDVIADNYFVIIDAYGDILEELEDEIFMEPREDHLQVVQQSKRDLIKLRKSVFPLREAVLFLERSDTKLVKAETAPFFRDVYDHVLHVTESIESFRELNTGLKDIYLSRLSMKMNEVMQTLTIIATIFIPLTFVAGVYGMNFENMPELGWKYGYLAVWIVMLAITTLLIFYFRRKRWF
jgi:magnesium transporter